MPVSAPCPQTLPRRPAKVSERRRKPSAALTCDFRLTLAHRSTGCEPLCEPIGEAVQHSQPRGRRFQSCASLQIKPQVRGLFASCGGRASDVDVSRMTADIAANVPRVGLASGESRRWAELGGRSKVVTSRPLTQRSGWSPDRGRTGGSQCHDRGTATARVGSAAGLRPWHLDRMGRRCRAGGSDLGGGWGLRLPRGGSRRRVPGSARPATRVRGRG